MAWSWVLAAAVLLAGPAWAEVVLPPGFAAEVYVTGDGFHPGLDRGVRGIPAVTSLAFDRTGTLYLGRAGWRFRGGVEGEELSPLYRIPPGGARLTPATESRYLYGPPLVNPQVGAVGPEGEVWVTTYDRDRKVGALYRMADRRPVLFAGGTPPAGSRPLFSQPEGVALDGLGRVYVADYGQGRVVRLDPGGRVLDADYARVMRPRSLIAGARDGLWIAADGAAAVPWQEGAGQIWAVDAGGAAELITEGPLASGIGLSPGGALFVAQRRTGRVLAVRPGRPPTEFARATDGTFLRGLAFAPVTPETRQAGLAGSLFLITVSRQVWTVTEVIRISGPFDDVVRRETPTSAP
jgi:hypothetical protein